ncbi:MAG: hypothetical protein V9G16_04790 [Nitrosomonas sp.]|jgi:hypothetical protein
MNKSINNRLEIHFSRIKLLKFIVVQLLLGSAAAFAASAPVAEDVIALLTLKQGQIAQLDQGKIVAFDIDEATQKELAIGLVMYFPSSPAKIAAFFKQGDLARVDPDISAHGEIKPGSTIEAFKGFVFTPEQRNEARNLLAAKAGDQFNLGAEEINSFTALKEKLIDANEADQITGVSQHYQQILFQRWQAYQKRGLAGIAPYARATASANPADELRSAATSSKLLAHLPSNLQQAWLKYPTQLPPATEERFFWLNRRVEDRSTAILSHRIQQTNDNFSVILVRQFFVGHSYNSSHLIIGCLPYRNGAIVFYAHRTSTDQVAGLGSGLKRSIGREHMKKQMIKNLKQLHSKIQSF